MPETIKTENIVQSKPHMYPEIINTAEQDRFACLEIAEKIKDKIERLLYVPTNLDLAKLIEKLAKYRVKAIIVENEDAIATEDKDDARENFLKQTETLEKLREQDVIFSYRINKPDVNLPSGESDYGRRDLEKILPLKPDFIVLPKLKDENELEKIIKLCEYYETPDYQTEFFLIIESLEAADFAILEKLIAHPRVLGVIPGAQDYGLSLLKKIYGQKTNWPAPPEISQMFLENFILLEDNLLALAKQHKKIALAPSSFIDHPKTAHHDYQYYMNLGFDGRTGINPKQFPQKINGEAPDKKIEKFFFELPYQSLIKRLRESEPGYFNSGKNKKADPDSFKKYPTQMGKPIIESIFLMLLFHLRQAKKDNNQNRIEEITKVLTATKQKFGYEYDI